MTLNAKKNPRVIAIGKRLSDLKRLMKPLEFKARLHPDWKENMTQQEARSLFDNANLSDELPVRGRDDRTMWNTIAKASFLC